EDSGRATRPASGRPMFWGRDLPDGLVSATLVLLVCRAGAGGLPGGGRVAIGFRRVTLTN
ncbi:MAG: hypothetical protein KDA47_23090, partial [Planctomycetales bacterium]|nr:hypothetical protein [Planctomycetales bacterium]